MIYIIDIKHTSPHIRVSTYSGPNVEPSRYVYHNRSTPAKSGHNVECGTINALWSWCPRVMWKTFGLYIVRCDYWFYLYLRGRIFCGALK